MARSIDLRSEDLSASALGDPEGIAGLIRDRAVLVAESVTLDNDGLVDAVGERVRTGVFLILRSLRGKDNLRPVLEDLVSSNLGRLEGFDAAYSDYARVFGARAVDVAAFLRDGKICARWQILRARGFIDKLSPQQSLQSEPVNADVAVWPGKRFFHYYAKDASEDFATRYWHRFSIHRLTEPWNSANLVVRAINSDCTLEVSYYLFGDRVVHTFSNVEPQFLTVCDSAVAEAA